jgi:hypothetical protein
VRPIFRNWNLGLIELFNDIMNWMIGLIHNLLSMSPQTFSPDAFNTAQRVSHGLTNVGITILILLWGIDFAGSTFSFKIKNTEEIIRLAIMLTLGYALTRASFGIIMGMFEFLSGLVVFSGELSIDFSGFTYNTREMILARSGIFNTFDMGNTENMILFVFLIFSFLSFFGMFLAMILVPVSIFIELYIYAAFAPIPLATLLTGRKEIGIAYLKLVASVCIRGSVVLVGMSIAMGIANSVHLMMPDFTDMGFWAFLLPVASITISIMVLQKGIKGAETFARAITGAGT